MSDLFQNMSGIFFAPLKPVRKPADKNDVKPEKNNATICSPLQSKKRGTLFVLLVRFAIFAKI